MKALMFDSIKKDKNTFRSIRNIVFILAKSRNIFLHNFNLRQYVEI